MTHNGSLISLYDFRVIHRTLKGDMTDHLKKPKKETGPKVKKRWPNQIQLSSEYGGKYVDKKEFDK